MHNRRLWQKSKPGKFLPFLNEEKIETTDSFMKESLAKTRKTKQSWLAQDSLQLCNQKGNYILDIRWKKQITEEIKDLDKRKQVSSDSVLQEHSTWNPYNTVQKVIRKEYKKQYVRDRY